MSGHGHVVPNPNGLKARCGGPGICTVCSKELLARVATETEKKFFDAIENPPAPTPELIKLLRDHAMLRHDDHTVYDEAADEIERLRARLEVHESGYDGISCRDETIRNQDAVIDNLRARVAELEAKRDCSISFRGFLLYGSAKSTAEVRRLLRAEERLAELEAAQEWRPMSEAPRDRHIDAVVDGEVRIVMWGKTSHVPIYGFCLADQGTEDFDICKPTCWRHRPAPPKVQT